MNESNTQKLFRTFPSLYQTVPRGRFQRQRQWLQEKFARWCRIKVPTLRESLIGFGFDHDDGWFDIIWRLSADLVKISRHIKAVQVKEKFGGLRFYAGYPSKVSDVVNARIRQAEAEAVKTCEVCGDPGELCLAGYWYRTVCRKPACCGNGNYVPVKEQ